ncbi:MAG TPA: serine/threonine protein kinase [Xanthomonadaceae bacterium]|nr:serine/threonine protein kinase [Xanthomonadaceae bacterium]
MPTAHPRPFADLLPERVLDAVESLGFPCDGRVLALNSYENRVYRVGLEDAAALVAKFYRPSRWSDAGILEEHGFAAELAAAELPVVAPVDVAGATLHRHGGYRFALYPLRGGHAPEPGDRDTLRYLGRVLGRLHAVGAVRRFQHRPALTVDRYGRDPVAVLLAGDWLPPHLVESFRSIAAAVLVAVQARFAQAGAVTTLRLHGDCHAGNLLWREDAVHIVDLDDAMTGPAMQDLWMFLSGSREDMRSQLDWLLEGYSMFRDFDLRELHLIEALRGLRLLHYNGWIAQRWDDPAFPAAFPWFGEPRWFESLIGQLQEQLSALQEPALDPP